MPQPQPRQQFGLQDIPMVEQNFMIKQEFQKCQKFLGFCDGKQQNNTNQLPPSNRNINRNQYLPAINGSHIRDVAQMIPYGSMNLVQDFPNGFIYTQQVQDQDSCLTGFDPQPFDAISLLGSPVDNMVYTFNQPTHLQDLSHDVANVLTVGTPTFDSDFNYSFSGNHFNVYSDQIPNCRVLAENSENMIPLARSFSQFNERQEQVLCPSLFPGKTTEYLPPHPSASFDPLEEKILFNTEDTNWNSSYGSGNTFEQSDDMNCLPSLQSGSWSALMQSAVAEASSSDNNGMQEEWSELSFQNTEISTDNELSGFVDGGKQQIGWADTSMQNHPTPCSKPTILFNDIVENNTFPGFQSSNTIFSVEDSDSSFGHVQQFFKTFDKPSMDNIQHSLQENDPFSYSLGGLDYVSADLNSRGRIESKDSLLETTVVPNLSMFNPDYITSEQFAGSHQLYTSENANISVKNYQNESLSWNPPPLGNSLQLLPGPYGQAEETCQKQRNDYRNDNFGYNYPSPNITRETEVLENVWSRTKCDSQPLACKNQRTLYQEGLSGPEKFLTEIEPLYSEKAADVHDPHITAPTRQGIVENVQQVSCSSSQTSLSQFSFTGVEDPWESAANWDDTPQNFGLRSAPPSQLQTSSNNLFPSHNSLQMGNSTNSQTSASLYPKKTFSALSATQSQNSIAGRKSMEVPLTCATPQDAFVSVSNTTPNNKPFQTLESVPTNSPYSDFPRISNSLELLMGHPKEQGVSHASTTRNSETFGTQNYSLLQQMQFLKKSEIDPSKRCHEKNPDSYTNTEKLHNSTHLQPELSCLQRARQEESAVHMTSMHEQTGSQILSNSNSMEFDKTEDLQISLQKGPSWFEQYYSDLRSSHILPAMAVPLLKPVSSSTIHDGRQTSTDARSRKRKISTSRLLPWNKVVEQCSLQQSMSMAQLEWTCATKRLPEKVEVEGETILQVQAHRSKKRLILTTQLMQQIFRPAEASMISSDISSNYDSMVYLTAKLALGDACCLSIKSGSGYNDDDAHEMKLNESPKRNNEVIFSKDVEEFEKRAKKLESDLLRMEKISITGNRVELKELEKFVVINRLARFHYRGATPQRYVVALPMPRALPDVAQCLSL